MDFSFSLEALLAPIGDAWEQCWHIGVAFLLALPIGWDREKQKGEQSAGLRTFPLVSVAACGIFLLGESIANGQPEPLARVIYGVVTGMGFLGGGAILKEGGHVSGLTTAASLWNTAAIGLAVGAEEFVIATALAVVNFVLLKAKRDRPDGPPATQKDGPL